MTYNFKPFPSPFLQGKLLEGVKLALNFLYFSNFQILFLLDPKEATLSGRLLNLPANIRLDWKGLPETNTLAYYKKSVNFGYKKFHCTVQLRDALFSGQQLSVSNINLNRFNKIMEL